MTAPSETDLTVAEVAAELRSTAKFVYNLIERGELPAIMYGSRFRRVSRAALDEFKLRNTGLTPAQKRAQLLGDETIAFITELAADAPPLTEQQKDIIRSAFRGQP